MRSSSSFLSLSDAEFNGDDDDVNKSPWQPGTPPLTLLRLLGIRQSPDNVPSQGRPPLPDPPLIPSLMSPKNIGRSNSSSALPSPSFFAGYSRPEVAGRQLPKVGHRQKNENEARQALLRALQSDAAVDEKPEVTDGDGRRLPHLQITPGGKQRRMSRDRDVTLSSPAAVDDVTDTTQTGNTTDDSDLSTVSKMSLSITSPTSSNSNNDSITASADVGLTSKDGVVHSNYDGQPADVSDDNETHGGDPFDAVRHKQLPVWPVPQHHIAFYPPTDQRRFGPPSFGGLPGHRPMYGASSRIHGPTGLGTAVQIVDLPSSNGQSSVNWNGVDRPASDTTDLPTLNPVDQAATNVRTSPNKHLEREENFDEAPKHHIPGLNGEEERTTSTSTSQPDDETGKTGWLSESDAGLPSGRPSEGDEKTPTTSSTSSSPVDDSITRRRSVLWGATSWIHSAGVALSATSLNLLGMYVCVSSSSSSSSYSFIRD